MCGLPSVQRRHNATGRGSKWEGRWSVKGLVQAGLQRVVMVRGSKEGMDEGTMAWLEGKGTCIFHASGRCRGGCVGNSV